jgi:uncharacterized protein (TIGR03086 family)
VTTIADRYRTRADAFERKVEAVRPDQWSNRSPCADWKARDVVGHIVDMHGVMLAPLGRGLSPAPSVSDDPLGAFVAARADVEAVLADPDLAGTEFDSRFVGPMTVEQHIDQVVSADLVIHGWDLARATGQDDVIAPDEVERAWQDWERSVASLGIDILRAPGVYGPEVKVPGEASSQERLLGLLGRSSNQE